MTKYKKELKKFKEFKKTYDYKQLEIIENGNTYLCDGIIIKDENGIVGQNDKWINVGYSLRENIQSYYQIYFLINLSLKDIH